MGEGFFPEEGSAEFGSIIEYKPLDDYSSREELVDRGYAVFYGEKNRHDQFPQISIDVVTALADVLRRLDLRKGK